MSIRLMLALQAASLQDPAGAPDLRGVDPPRIPRALTATSRCKEDGELGDVVVCGFRPDRFRLPLPNEHDSGDVTSKVRGEASTGMAALTPAGRCGMFEGERRCGKAEAAQYGYGQGRDPITFLTKLGTKLLDPDAEISKPSKVP